jgi:WD40 repeat protein
MLQTFSSIGDTVNGMAISPDGTRILSTSNDSTLHLWGIQSGTLIGPAFVGHQRPSVPVVFGPDGKWAISSGDDLNGMIVWTIPSLEWACTHRSYQTPLTVEEMSRYEITQAMIDSLNAYCGANSDPLPKN